MVSAKLLLHVPTNQMYLASLVQFPDCRVGTSAYTSEQGGIHFVEFTFIIPPRKKHRSLGCRVQTEIMNGSRREAVEGRKFNAAGLKLLCVSSSYDYKLANITE